MHINAINSGLFSAQKTSQAQALSFNNAQLSFSGSKNLLETVNSLSADGLNMIFTPATKATKGISFNGKNTEKKNILVTGGAGYIGSHTAKFLLENGYNIVVIDNLSLGNKGAVKELSKIAKENNAKFKFYEVDLSQKDKVGKILKNNNIEAVVHFAAFSQVGESMKDPLKYYMNNTGKTAMLLDEMVKNGVKKIVFSSTAATYGAPDVPIIEETTAQKPINPYGVSKLMVEKIMDDADQAHGLKSVRLRYFNVAGASSDGRLGEVHNPETHLIPKLLEPIAARMQGKEAPPFKMFGTDYPTKDGTAIRDYIHVEDLANAHFLALKRLFNGGDTAFYNLGTGSGSSVKDVYESCKRVTKQEIPLEISPRRAGDPPVLIASNKKATKELGWAPKKTLDDMISSAWNWMQNPKFKS